MCVWEGGWVGGERGGGWVEKGGVGGGRGGGGGRSGKKEGEGGERCLEVRGVRNNDEMEGGVKV